MANFRELLAATKAQIREITPEQAERERGRATFVDVREADEFDQGTIPGSVFIPRGHLESQRLGDGPGRRRRVEVGAGPVAAPLPGGVGGSDMVGVDLADVAAPDRVGPEVDPVVDGVVEEDGPDPALVEGLRPRGIQRHRIEHRRLRHPSATSLGGLRSRPARGRPTR